MVPLFIEFDIFAKFSRSIISAPFFFLIIFNHYFKNITIKHEKIHIMQAEKTQNSWFCFYCKYIWFWLKAMFLCKFKNSIAYYCNPFEVEAYMHEKQKYYSCNEYDFYQKIPIAVYVSIYKSAKNFSDFLMHILEYKLTNKELR